MDECLSESSYFCADPGVELGRAMDAAAHESGSERPEGERVGRLLGAENSEEESGEKPKDEGEAEERAAGEGECDLVGVEGGGWASLEDEGEAAWKDPAPP